MTDTKDARDTSEAQGAAASSPNPAATSPATAGQSPEQTQTQPPADEPLHVDEEVR